MRVGIGQINTKVGDIKGNMNKIKQYYDKFKNEYKGDILVFPELTVTGYPPEDLLYNLDFLNDVETEIVDFIKYTKNDNVLVILGAPIYDNGLLYNRALVIGNGRLYGQYSKQQLPNYSVFDEKRYFAEGKVNKLFYVNNHNLRFGVTICEDLWISTGPANNLAKRGADIIFNISASPYNLNKEYERLRMLETRASDISSYIVYANLVGGQDELVFDGRSLIINPSGKLEHFGEKYKEELIVYDIDMDEADLNNIKSLKKNKLVSNDYVDQVFIDDIKFNKNKPKLEIPLRMNYNYFTSEIDNLWNSLVLGLRDYVYKNGFKKVVFGLSGGIDSALVAALAAEALGPENVLGIMMPSEYSSPESVTDSNELIKNLGIKYEMTPIKAIYDVYMKAVIDVFSKKEFSVANENIQARIRGNIVMAYSNQFGYLPLATGNKSEMAVGYSTLYGDMVGGFAPIKDVYKTQVYKLADYYNNVLKGYEAIPMNIIKKAPSAELKPGQIDQEKLPPYEVLDKILSLYIDKNYSFNMIVQRIGENYKEVVRDVLRMVDNNEFKRKQAPIGLKVSERVFGKDRRMPITNKYRA